MSDADKKAQDGGSQPIPDLITEARSRVEADPNDVKARADLARLYRERGDADLALEHLDAALSRSPGDPDLVLERVEALVGLGHYQDAEGELRRLQRLDQGSARVHSQLGILFIKRGLYRHAEAEFARAIQLDDTLGDAFVYRGEALNQLGLVEEALEMLERGVQLQPRNARAYYTMGILYDRKHLHQEASTMYRKARDLGAA